MANAIAGWIGDLILKSILDPVLKLLAWTMVHVGNGSLALAQQPWVATAADVSTAIAGSLLFLNLAYRATTEYVLWNEGSSSDAAGTLGKGVLRVVLYGSAGTTIAYLTFRFGILLAAAYMATPLTATVNHLQLIIGAVLAGPSLLVFGLMLAAAVIAVVVVFLQMFVRAAELTIYIIAAPIVALGQMNRDGGIWSNWWRSLVILSMSTAAQWLALKGLVATAVTTLLGTPGGQFVAILQILAWAYVAIRGPHMLREWSYRTGFAQGGQAAASQAISYRLMRAGR